jgi:aminocarboxymuconate-semialdehyde decarboxylase
MATRLPFVLDVHAHDIPENFVEALNQRGKDFGARVERSGGETWIRHDEGYRYPLSREFADVDVKLADMDRRGIDVTVLSPSPTFFAYERDAGVAEEMASLLNDGTAQMAAASGGRLFGMAVAPLQDPVRAQRELERAVKAHGFRALEVGSHIAGVPLSDPELRPFWRRVRELDLLTFVHPYYTGVKPRMERFYLTNLIGNPLDTVLAIADICFSGLLDEIPGLKFMFAHGGGFAPYQVGRLRHGFRVRQESRTDTRRSPDEAFRELYFDTITHDAPALRYLVESVGASRVFLGTDLPFDMADGDPLETLAAARLGEEQERLIAGGNLRAQFGLGQDAPTARRW